MPFRNVFPREADFTFSVDNPAFVLGRISERLGPKKATSITVTFKPELAAAKATSSGSGSRAGTAAGGGSGSGGGGPAAAAGSGSAAAVEVSRTGKLTVSCPKQTSCQWVFYLSA